MRAAKKVGGGGGGGGDEGGGMRISTVRWGAGVPVWTQRGG